METVELVVPPGRVQRRNLPESAALHDPPGAQWDPFGGPANPVAAESRDWLSFLNRMSRRSVPEGGTTLSGWMHGSFSELVRHLERDTALMAVTGRWKPGPLDDIGRISGLEPGDVSFVRHMSAAGMQEPVVFGLAAWADLPPEDRDPAFPSLVATDLGSVLFVYDAVPFFLPATVAPALLASDPPDDGLLDNVRLPFPSVLVFFDEVPLDDLGDSPVEMDFVGVGKDEVTDIGLVGAVLFAGPDGTGLSRHAQLITVSTHVHRGFRGVQHHNSVWPRSRYAHAVANLAALLTWGDWQAPRPVPPQFQGSPGSREWRKSFKKSAVRKAERHGGLADVRVLDYDPRKHAARNEHGDPLSPGRASPRTHWRRGHWRRTWRGSDADGTRHTVVNWIPPKVVNPGKGSSGTKVYRIG